MFSRNYESSCYIAPVVSGNLGVAFDLLDFSSAQGGTIYMDSVAIDYLTIP